MWHLLSHSCLPPLSSPGTGPRWRRSAPTSCPSPPLRRESIPHNSRLAGVGARSVTEYPTAPLPRTQSSHRFHSKRPGPDGQVDSSPGFPTHLFTPTNADCGHIPGCCQSEPFRWGRLRLHGSPPRNGGYRPKRPKPLISYQPRVLVVQLDAPLSRTPRIRRCTCTRWPVFAARRVRFHPKQRGICT